MLAVCGLVQLQNGTQKSCGFFSIPRPTFCLKFCDAAVTIKMISKWLKYKSGKWWNEIFLLGKMFATCCKDWLLPAETWTCIFVQHSWGFLQLRTGSSDSSLLGSNGAQIWQIVKDNYSRIYLKTAGLKTRATLCMIGNYTFKLKWLNNVADGPGDRSQGAVKVLYSTSLSERGVLFCAHRKPRAKDPFDFQVRNIASTSPWVMHQQVGHQTLPYMLSVKNLTLMNLTIMNLMGKEFPVLLQMIAHFVI